MPTAWVLALWVSSAAAAPAPACLHTRIEAIVANDLRSVRGTFTCEPADNAPRPITLAAYPRLLRAPHGIDDVTSRWQYPNDFDAGDMLLWQGGALLKRDGPWQPVDPGPPGTPWVVHFETHLPARNGTLAWDNNIAYLLGGWHPAISQGPRLAEGPIEYAMRFPANTVGFVGRTPVGRNSPRLQTGTFTGKYLPMLVAPNAQVTVHKDAVLIVPSGERVPPRDHPEMGLAELTSGLDGWAQDHVLETVQLGAEFARAQGLPTPPLVVVQAPLRSHLVEPFDGGLAVSDRAFHVLAWELVRRFHRASIWREQLGKYTRVHALEVELLPPEVAADAVAAALRSRLWATRYGGHESAPDLLEHIAIIPEIDALIFAPQVPFIDTYYDAVDETQPARLRLDDFYNDFPRGKVLYEKLKDTLGDATVQSLVDTYLHDQRPLLDVVQAQTGRDMQHFAQRWLGPYPRINYTVSGIAPTPNNPNHVRVLVTQEGPEAGWVQEPVTVEVQDDDGLWHRAARTGPGPIDVDLQTPEPPNKVQLDPEGRLVELWHPPGYGPRFDNRLPPRWRFLLNNITGLLAITNQQLSATADFTLRRIHDLTYDFEFYALVGPGTVTAAAAGSYNFGAEITPLRLAEALSLTLNYNHLRLEKGITLPGDEITASFQYDYDTRLSPYASFAGQGVSVVATGGFGRAATGMFYGYGHVGVSGLQIFQVGLNQALVTRLRADAMLGSPAPQDLLRLGSRYIGARGYEQDEVRGNLRLLASAEYRHVLTGQSRTDFFGLVMLTRLEGGLFADVAYLPTQRADCPHSGVYYDVGYGVRLLMDMLNLSPASVQVDFGLPLNRCSTEAAVRPPLTIYLGFVQSFSSF